MICQGTWEGLSSHKQASLKGKCRRQRNSVPKEHCIQKSKYKVSSTTSQPSSARKRRGNYHKHSELQRETSPQLTPTNSPMSPHLCMHLMLGSIEFTGVP